MGGFAATAVMTFMMYFVAPMMIGQPMDIAAMLGSMLGDSWALGMMAHADDGRRILQLSSGRDDGGYGFLDGSYRVRGDTRWGCRCSRSRVGQVVVRNRTGAFN